MSGWNEKILKVNLSTRTIKEENLDAVDKRLFLGGRGLGVKWVYDRGKVEPLSPENLLILATGPLTGTGTFASGRTTAATKSPLTGLICNSNVGGSFGVQMKRCGYDAIIIDGASSAPVYLEISPDGPALRSAGNLWGKNTGEVFKILGDYESVLCIGVAGESRVRFASVIHNGSHALGRGGLGAVMGAKLLKAVALRDGAKKTTVASPAEFKTRQQNLLKIIKASPVLKNLTLLGTPSLLKVIHWAGILPFNNFGHGSSTDLSNLSAEAVKALYPFRNKGCKACPVACKKETGNGVPLPEFETIAMMGPNNNNYDFGSILELNTLCNEYGLDTISTGATLACYSEIKGQPLKREEMYRMVCDIGEAKGTGAELMQGSRKYAESCGRDGLSISVKGLELPAYDPRGVYGLALAYGTSNRGGCHLGAYMIAPEVLRKPKAISPLTFAGKPSYLAVLQNAFAAVDSLIVCKFACLAAGQEEYANILSAVTGEEYSADDLNVIGERIWNLERLYNLREGISLEDDYLPERFYSEELVSKEHSFTPLSRQEYEKALQEYYKCRGWNENGVPTDAKLEKLGLR